MIADQATPLRRLRTIVTAKKALADAEGFIFRLTRCIELSGVCGPHPELGDLLEEAPSHLNGIDAALKVLR